MASNAQSLVPLIAPQRPVGGGLALKRRPRASFSYMTFEVVSRRPNSPAAGMSLDPLVLPDPPRFLGPGSRTIATAKWTAPLLIGGWFSALALQGVLSLPLLMVGTGLGLTLAAGSELWLRHRKRTLKRVARALSRYAERALGPQHELTGRARALSRHAAQSEEEGTGSTTNLEEGLRYTWELVRLGR